MEIPPFKLTTFFTPPKAIISYVQKNVGQWTYLLEEAERHQIPALGLFDEKLEQLPGFSDQ